MLASGRTGRLVIGRSRVRHRDLDLNIYRGPDNKSRNVLPIRESPAGAIARRAALLDDLKLFLFVAILKGISRLSRRLSVDKFGSVTCLLLSRPALTQPETNAAEMHK